jgi:hypothetical protein
LSDLPNQEDFPFTDGVLQAILKNPRVTIRKEIEKGCLFLVNYKISFFFFLKEEMWWGRGKEDWEERERKEESWGREEEKRVEGEQVEILLRTIYILEIMEDIPAIPIALFWWDNVNKHLFPIAIQVFQKYHPENNPLVTPGDGLLWEAAKISLFILFHII